MRKSTATVVITLGAAGLTCSVGPRAQGAVVQLPTGSSSWNTAANWNPAVPPNAVGDNATFNGAATGSNPAQTGNRTLTLDGSKTVGSILFNTNLSSFTNTISTGTTGPLVFDETGAGPATITTQGGGTGNNTISVAMRLDDSLTASVNNTSATSTAGSLNLTGAMSGNGGVTKTGDGLMTFGTGAKTYTGATVLSGGRTRMSLAARPQSTSGLTINAGAQLTLITNGSYTFGSGTLNLNGSGPTTGPFAAFRGAIRNDTDLDATITNNVSLQSDSLIHVEGTSSGRLTLSGTVSGVGRLRLAAPNSSPNQGALFLTAANTYSGGTLVTGGSLWVQAAGGLGVGDVTVDNTDSPNSGAGVVLSADDAIADNATVRLLGGGVPNFADTGVMGMAVFVDDTVGALFLGGLQQFGIGTYGATGSGADFISDEYFYGPGVIRLVPEPATGGVALPAAATVPLLARRRRRRT